ncbi:MAG: phosphate ABC transporter, permease protein PstA [Hyphomicrobiales bacterium]|nr:MAG: phosphate ABC transporter, permease protein PstA [Hyphomicrobiales bacterium]
MTDFTVKTPALKRRHAAEKRFQWYGLGSIIIALGFLLLMVGSITIKGIGAFTQTRVALEIELPSNEFNLNDLKATNYGAIVKKALRNAFPDVTKRRDKRKLYGLVSPYASFELQKMVIEDPALIGKTTKIWFVASDDVDMYIKGNVDTSIDEKSRKFSDKQIAWVEEIQKKGDLEKVFNSGFFTGGDSREPELAGILSAFMGSALSLSVCFLLSFPIGIFAAIYLEEFAKKNRWSALIEININNLAAVPSIVFGLLGLAVFLNVFGLPRSSPLVGGMVLSLMTLPTIIIASRASLRAVPPSIREAALGIGASQVQAAFHHVVPLALPGMLTGAIVGMARALGDTAPLLMIGMVAFIVDIPTGVLDKATALPVQIFLWADSPERGFMEKTSAAILVLLVFLVLMNLVAIILRRKFEQRF